MNLEIRVLGGEVCVAGLPRDRGGGARLGQVLGDSLVQNVLPEPGFVGPLGFPVCAVGPGDAGRVQLCPATSQACGVGVRDLSGKWVSRRCFAVRFLPLLWRSWVSARKKKAKL